MLHAFKRRLYFVVARYFRFWAGLSLRRWQPTVIVVTGSAGKTTLLHLLEAQLGQRAHYSHHANSAYGIPFDILGLDKVSRSRLDWVGLVLKAPLRSLKKVHAEQLYVAEVDADRLHEAQFIAQLLHPDVTLWVSSLHTHTIGFDAAVKSGGFDSAEAAIAHEYGNIVALTSKLVVYDADNPLVQAQMSRTQAQTSGVKLSSLKNYRLHESSTNFTIDSQTVVLPAIVPKATYYQLAMTSKLMDYLELPLDKNYANFVMPPGRSNRLAGRKGSTLIDSTYNNSNLDSMREVVEMFAAYPAKTKWLVLGDMLEQGKDEAREHRKIAALLEPTHFDRVLLVGKRLSAYTVPALSPSFTKQAKMEVFEHPAKLRDYLLQEITGKETIMFKGAGFLEGVIEAVLADKADTAQLVRQGAIEKRRRKEFGL